VVCSPVFYRGFALFGSVLVWVCGCCFLRGDYSVVPSPLVVVGAFVLLLVLAIFSVVSVFSVLLSFLLVATFFLSLLGDFCGDFCV